MLLFFSFQKARKISQLPNQHFPSPNNGHRRTATKVLYGKFQCGRLYAVLRAINATSSSTHTAYRHHFEHVDRLHVVETNCHGRLCTRGTLSFSQHPRCTPFIYFSQSHHFLFLLQREKAHMPCNHFPLRTSAINLIYMISIIDFVNT